MEPRRSKHYLAMSPELSILFFILRAIDRDALKKEQENADYASDFRAEDTRADQSARPVGCDDETVYGHDIPTAEQKNAKKWHKNLTTLCTVFGAIFLVAGLAGLGDIIDLWGYWFDWGEFITALTQILGGGASRWWSGPSTMAISEPMPTSTTAPAPSSCGAQHPSRPRQRKNPRRSPPRRTSILPCKPSSGMPTRPSPIR